MKGKTVILLCLTLLILCPLTTISCCIDSPNAVQTQEIMNISILSYEESLPIHISNNSDFVNQASANSWDGNGSVSDPYIIENLNITVSGNSPIQIGNTTVFFEVRGCLIVGGSTGILLQNVTNAKIWNTIIRYTDSCGLLVTESESVLVTNNTIYGISGTEGVYSLGSDHCEFSNNTIVAVSGWGILLDYSNNCSITDNYLGSTAYDGIGLRDSSENNITLNEISHSHLSGIKLGNSHRCNIEQNFVGPSVTDGISVEASSNCRIVDNVLYLSGGYSLDIAGNSNQIIRNTFYESWMQGLRCQSNNNNVTQNNFIQNNLAFSEFATWLVDLGINNDIAGNYYEIWTWPDENEDDIVDTPYLYNDVSGLSDNEPHVKVFQTDLMHILTQPRLIYPNETMAGEKFWGLIQLSWSIASDTFGHDAMYNVSVSANGGSSWIEIAHSLIDTNLDWNSSEFSESAEYIFKVVAQCTDGLTSEYITNAEYEVKSHILSIPTVLTPNGGETIVGSYDITWTESVESWGLQVVYDVYYSADAGETWTEIINTLEYTSIDWDVRGLPDGDQYLIRIVARGTSGLVTEDVSDSTFIISRANYTIIIASVAGIAFVIAIVAYGLRKRGTI
jgi:parallel beta-helix repeat protein